MGSLADGMRMLGCTAAGHWLVSLSVTACQSAEDERWRVQWCSSLLVVTPSFF